MWSEPYTEVHAPTVWCTIVREALQRAERRIICWIIRERAHEER